jgi:hypothetical protein
MNISFVEMTNSYAHRKQNQKKPCKVNYKYNIIFCIGLYIHQKHKYKSWA